MTPFAAPAKHILAATLLLTCALTTHAQASDRPCPPPSEQPGQPGPACFISKQPIGILPAGDLFWHLDQYPDRAHAEVAKAPRSTVVESLGKVWLFTIADKRWSPTGGTHIATVGPLPTQPGITYEAVYMQSIFAPGQTAPLHTHSGVEAFYTLTGDTCLETSAGIQTGHGTGHINLVPAGLPMLLMATGTETRRGVVLILHDANHPATTMEHDWKPKGLCKP